MDYTKTCWYCGKPVMKKQDGFYVCTSCGATWNEIAKLEPVAFEEGSVMWVDSHKITHRVGAGHPSPALLNQTKKLKEAKKV